MAEPIFEGVALPRCVGSLPYHSVNSPLSPHEKQIDFRRDDAAFFKEQDEPVDIINESPITPPRTRKLCDESSPSLKVAKAVASCLDDHLARVLRSVFPQIA